MRCCMSDNIIEILWTGGWDSTFRIIMLSQKDVAIQPYYISDNRKSEQQELHAINNIIHKLNELPMKATIKPLIYYKVSDLEKDPNIKLSYEELRKKIYFGTQYEWLAQFAKEHPNVELCIHKDDKALEVINTFGALTRIETNNGTTYILDKSKSDVYLCNIFGNFSFPIIEFTKLDMKKIIEGTQYESIMNQTWFCHKPYKGEPCGICNPCRYTIEEGMTYRFSKKALKRYKLYTKCEKYRLLHFITKIFKRIV